MHLSVLTNAMQLRYYISSYTYVMQDRINVLMDVDNNYIMAIHNYTLVLQLYTATYDATGLGPLTSDLMHLSNRYMGSDPNDMIRPCLVNLSGMHT